MKPPFAYFGGKTAIAERIVRLLPPHEHYVEPFCGSLSVLLAKRPSKLETVNDLDGNLMTFWRMVRERPQDLERACALTPHSRAEHEASYDLDIPDDLERARRVWIRLSQGRAGTLRRTGWKYYTDPNGTSSSMPRYLLGYASRIAPVAERMANVSLECRPALEVIATYGVEPKACLYVDPPYLASVRGWGNNYAVEMRTDPEHEALAEALSATRAAVVLSGYRSPLYERLYGDWHQQEIPAMTGNGTNLHRLEVLWSNRPFPHVQGQLDLMA